MSDRDAFEKWAVSDGRTGYLARLSDGEYASIDVGMAWECWKSARAEAFKECIYLAERTHPDDFVDAIRALMEKSA